MAFDGLKAFEIEYIWGGGASAELPAELRRRNSLGTIMKATATLQLENERVIITEYRFAPGAETGYHVHAHDYVVVPLTDGILRLYESAGARDARLEVGVSYARPAGVAHNVVNVNDFEFRFVEVELKS